MAIGSTVFKSSYKIHRKTDADVIMKSVLGHFVSENPQVCCLRLTASDLIFYGQHVAF